jgi:hypothetical protein
MASLAKIWLLISVMRNSFVVIDKLFQNSSLTQLVTMAVISKINTKKNQAVISKH